MTLQSINGQSWNYTKHRPMGSGCCVTWCYQTLQQRTSPSNTRYQLFVWLGATFAQFLESPLGHLRTAHSTLKSRPTHIYRSLSSLCHISDLRRVTRPFNCINFGCSIDCGLEKIKTSDAVSTLRSFLTFIWHERFHWDSNISYNSNKIIIKCK